MVWRVKEAVEKAAEQAVKSSSEEVKKVDQACEGLEEEGLKWWHLRC